MPPQASLDLCGQKKKKECIFRIILTIAYEPCRADEH